MRSRLFSLYLLFIFATNVSASLPGKIIPDVPDASQPPPSNSANWCVPMAAVNIIDYWANVQCRAGAFGLLGVSPPEVASEDIGWFCGTNGAGSPNRMNTHSLWPGTLTSDIQAGVDEFIQWDIYHLYNNPNPILPQKMSAAWILDTDSTLGFSYYKNEIDEHRPAIVCFSNWDLVLSDSVKDPSLQETVYVYRWADPIHNQPQINGAPEETWFPDDNAANAPGHTVTGYGYWEIFDPDTSGTPTNWVIVRDNWLVTPKAVAVPWNYWKATVALNPGEYVINVPFTDNPYSIDGLVTLFEKLNATSVTIRNSNAIAYVRATTQQTLYIIITNIRNTASQIFEYRLCFDVLDNGGQAPQTDDIEIIVRTDGTRLEKAGNGAVWTSTSISGWNSAFSLPLPPSQFYFEIEIDYAKLGLFRGYCDTLGFSIWESQTDTWGWPSASSEHVPCTWGDMISTDCFTPVELSSFLARTDGRDVELRWRTESESNNIGFRIERSVDGKDFHTVGYAPGSGTTNQPRTYVWQDQNLQPGAYAYQLRQIDTDGETRVYGPRFVEIKPPTEFIVSPVYPNPFNGTARIDVLLPGDSHLLIDVYDVMGRKIDVLADDHYSAGFFSFFWNGMEMSGFAVPTGSYYIRVKSDLGDHMQRVLVLR